MAESDYQPVVFEDSEGNEISNDPVWKARKTLAQYGASEPTAPVLTTAAPTKASDAADALSDDGDQPKDYTELKGKELTDYAKSRGIDPKELGLTTVGEVRSALVAKDAEEAAAKAVEDANSADAPQE